MRAILIHELRAGWRAPVLLAAAFGLLATRLAYAPLYFGQTWRLSAIVLGLAAVLGLTLGVARVRAEDVAPGFLASRPVSPRIVLGAKVTSALVDLLIAAPGLLALAYVIHPSTDPHDLMSFAATALILAWAMSVLGAIVVWHVGSPWIAGTVCVVAAIVATAAGAKGGAEVDFWGYLDEYEWDAVRPAAVAFAILVLSLARGRR